MENILLNRSAWIKPGFRISLFHFWNEDGKTADFVRFRRLPTAGMSCVMPARTRAFVDMLQAHVDAVMADPALSQGAPGQADSACRHLLF